jgi:predicted Zn-dependent peptidase
MLGGLMGDLDGPFQIMSRWKTYLLNELPDHYFDESVASIRAMTPQRLQELANRYLDPAAFFELVVV